MTGVKPGLEAAFYEDYQTKSGNLVVVLELRKGNDVPSMACEVVQKAVCASVGVQPSRLVAISEGEICKALNGKIRRRNTRDALLGGTLNIVHEQVCALVDFKSVEEPYTVELGVELQETEQLPISSPVCITDGVDSTETPSLLQSDALKIALNYEVRENLVLNVLTKIAQGISGKCVDTHAPLMESGFDSLSLAELAVRVQEKVVVPAGIRLEVTTMDMYELTTLHAIARRLIESGEEGKHGILDSTKKIETCSKGDFSGQIAVVGMACRFPGGANSPEELWTKVLEPAKDCIGMPPPSRLHSPSGKDWQAGYIEDMELFDNDKFGISPEEAEVMHPAQRHMLEVGYEALMNAGFTESELKGEHCGVFVGVSNTNVLEWKDHSARAAMGNIESNIANRLSYALGLTGPSYIIDSACSASLVALDTACNNLNAGICDSAGKYTCVLAYKLMWLYDDKSFVLHDFQLWGA